MKSSFLNTLFCFVLLFVSSKSVFAQLNFPNGNVLNLNTSEDFLYIETRVLFNTGKFKANDYSWSKIFDSLDSRWLITACFNGDCRDELLQSGTFLKDFGLNDTTCFIAFHVETHEYTGISKIIYHIFNKNNSLDSATVTYNISYSKPSGIDDFIEKSLNIFPNPVTNKLNIETAFDLQDATLKIVNSLGEIVLFKQLNIDKEFDVSNLKKGVYFLNIISNNKTVSRKFIKQ
ncbi:MAG: T9SS type A sorting domain-containing protein [Bacteroidia bacterium]